MTASSRPHVCLLLVILLVFGYIIHLLFVPVLRIKKDIWVWYRIIGIESEEWLHYWLLLLRVKFCGDFIFFLHDSLLWCVRVWRCGAKVVLLSTHYLRGHFPASIGRSHTILACLDLIHIGCYPVSVLAMLATQRCFQRRVASPAWVTRFWVRNFAIIALRGLVASESVSELDAVHMLVLLRSPDIQLLLHGRMLALIWSLRGRIQWCVALALKDRIVWEKDEFGILEMRRGPLPSVGGRGRSQLQQLLLLCRLVGKYLVL